MVSDSLRQCKIANRNKMRRRIAWVGMPAAISKRVELLGIAEVQTGLIVNPGS